METDKSANAEIDIKPNASKSLSVLRSEWADCQACELGERRVKLGGEFVFGEGTMNGIMFIGEGPGKDEEKEGRPFIGKSGKLLRDILTKLAITDHYITNIVACRSCAPITDAEGNQIFTKGYKDKPAAPKYHDQPPNKPHIAACRRRLAEEIYLVDPVIIVALGGTAVSALRGSSASMMRDRGNVETIEIPGALDIPSLTPSGVWKRKYKGEVTYPTVQNKVRYLMLPTLHPAFVLRRANDFSKDNPFKLLVDDIRQAAEIYNKYMLEAHGIVPGELYREIPYELLKKDEEDSE